MSSCKDPRIGNLLLAYELDGLTDGDVELVETHMLECEYCFEQMSRFGREAALLRSDDDIRELVRESSATDNSESEPILRAVYRYVWPDTPFIFKPAFAYFIILLLILPAYFGLKKPDTDQIRSVQNVTLLPDRSGADGTFRAGPRSDGLLSFVCVGAIAGESYRVVIQSEENEIIHEDNAFSDFDEYETGRLLLPLSKMKPGTYQLEISGLDGDSATMSWKYSFSIQE